MYFYVLQLYVHVVIDDITPQCSTIESYFVKKTDNFHVSVYRKKFTGRRSGAYWR